MRAHELTDPVAAITRASQQLVLAALDSGWGGPPFDPLALAKLNQVDVVSNADIPEAQTVPVGSHGLRIEFNPERPRARIRFSVAHELAHTLFPDCRERVRQRTTHRDFASDEWQLEALCNLAAGEILMPAGSLAFDAKTHTAIKSVSLNRVMMLRKRYDVSAEAIAQRLVRTSSGRCGMAIMSSTSHGRVRIEYAVSSASWSVPQLAGMRLPSDSILSKPGGALRPLRVVEDWGKAVGQVEMETTLVGAAPGSTEHRLLAILRPLDGDAYPARGISYLHGDALCPMHPRAMIVHVVNDKTANWGGAGFAAALRRAFPEIQDDFRDWTRQHTNNLRLGRWRIARALAGICVASIVAQHGYGPSSRPRIRYAALREGLVAIARVAREDNMTLHMPRIGAGQAGGSWCVIEDLLRDTCVASGLEVTVYDLPARRWTSAGQGRLL